MNLKKITIIICIVWIIIVSLWIIRSEYTLNTGIKVLLKTIPVDPKDLLMGDYVILNYEIGQIPEKYKNNNDYSLNKDVYVVLKTDINNIATIDRIIIGEKPDKPLYIKGKISKCNTIIPLWKTGVCINYGIENYYVKERTGMDLERNLRNGALVEISVDKYGNAKVKGFVDKK